MTKRKGASRCTETASDITASAAGPAATCWTSWGAWRASPCPRPSGGWMTDQRLWWQRRPTTRLQPATTSRPGNSAPGPGPADGGGAVLRRATAAQPDRPGVPGIPGHRPGYRPAPGSGLRHGPRPAGAPASRRVTTQRLSTTAACSWNGARNGSTGPSPFPTWPGAGRGGSLGGRCNPTPGPGSRRCPAPSRCWAWPPSARRRPG